MLRNITISITGNSAVSAFTSAEPTVKTAEALRTKMIACRRAARRSARARLTADVSIGVTLRQPVLHLHSAIRRIYRSTNALRMPALVASNHEFPGHQCSGGWSITNLSHRTLFASKNLH